MRISLTGSGVGNMELVNILKTPITTTILTSSAEGVTSISILGLELRGKHLLSS